MSNLTARTDALMNTTNYEYDDFNRLKKVLYPPSVVGAIRLEEGLEYDTVGNVKKRFDTANRETLFDYDTANRLIKTTDADLKQTQFEYNPRSQMTKVIDAPNQVYDFSYDALGRQLSQTRSGNSMSYEYDAVGNRTKRIDYLSQVTNYTFDNLNRLTNISYPDATENVVLTYDVVSRLTKATKNLQDVTFAYDTRHRMTSTTDVFGQVVASVYDAASNRTQMKLNTVRQASYVYDVANRLTRITDEVNGVYNFTYDNADKMLSMTRPNTVKETLLYDGMSRLTQMKEAKGATVVSDNQYGYNAANQISQIAELTQTKNFGYDNVDRLTAMTNGTTNENYIFDSVGNRTSSHLSASYTHQPFNKLTNTATASYVYNSNGNLTSKTDVSGTTQYIWDYENRLKQVNKPDGTSVNYKYDALSRRIERTQGTNWTRFTYDGLDVIKDTNSDGTTISYLNGLGIDNKLKQITGGQTQYFLKDHLGSTIGLTDSSGNVVSSASYDSFGNSTNNLSTRYQYTGREYDSFTGLTYYRARWYDANLGRFISEDPIGFAGGDVNFFGYVHNNSINRNDPFGLIDLGWDSPTGPPVPYSTLNSHNNDNNAIFDPYSNVASYSDRCSCEIENPELIRMKEIFQQQVTDMTAKGQRINNGVVNNLTSSGQGLYNITIWGYLFPTNRVGGCGEQAEELNRRLQNQFDSKWQLEKKYGFYYGFYHEYSVAYSSNPNDPIVILDSWDNNFETRRRRK